MTEKLYDKDAYISEFEAAVLSVGEDERGHYAVLDKTAFFPEQGGQYSDKGTIGGVRVTDVQIVGGEIRHYADAPLEAGKRYDCRLVFVERFMKMQNHTGEHIVSGIVHSMYGFENVGFHLGDGDMTMDYDGFLTRDQLREIEYKANEAIIADIPVYTEYPCPEKLATLKYRSKLDLTENVRIVTIPGIDTCACCAPQVKKTGEVGIIKLLDAFRHRGGIRIHALCGYDALADYNAKYDAIQKIALTLTTKQEDAADAVDRLIAENAQLRYQLTGARNELLRMKASMLAPTDGNLVVFEDTSDMDALRGIFNEAVGKCGGICAVFGKKDGGYAYVIGSRTVDMADETKKINGSLGGRGGGRNGMIMGSVTADESEIRKYFGV